MYKFCFSNIHSHVWSFSLRSNPTPEPLEAPIGNGLVQFSEFTADAFNMMNIAREVKDDINYRSKYNAFFSEYLSYIININLYSEKRE